MYSLRGFEILMNIARTPNVLIIALLFAAASLQAQTAASFSTASAQFVRDGLVGWWKGDHNAFDIVARNDGTLFNGTYVKGVIGQAFSFDPDNSPGWTGVQIPDRPAYALTDALTITGWIRPQGNGYIIFWRGDNRPGLDPYALSMQGDHDLAFIISDEEGNNPRVDATIPYHQWTHVAAIFDSSIGTMSLYINGVLAAQTVTAVRPFAELQPDSSPGVGIGNLNDGVNNFPFVGDIDEIALFDRALSANEIQRLYRVGGGKVHGHPKYGLPLFAPH